ncbi:Hypothetical predicted protein [Pelobates cultripes]|uniref:Uncharacterized protein n=1 Tax=Pelobates cultripes TaxID=61616 RepID=A0AAD1RTP7_PELCU|nr:Hypothetical predicted protein [Pelobates cultripes]
MQTISKCCKLRNDHEVHKGIKLQGKVKKAARTLNKIKFIRYLTEAARGLEDHCFFCPTAYAKYRL